MKVKVYYNPFNARRVERRDDTIFVPLPKSAWSPITGGCDCEWCVMHPDAVPSWDTLALRTNDRDAPRSFNSKFTWAVHRPELAHFEARYDESRPEVRESSLLNEHGEEV